MLRILCLTALLGITSVFASETDDFTHRNDPLADMAEVINDRANAYLRIALREANLSGYCNEEALYAELKKYFANHTSGKLSQFILTDSRVARIAFPLKNSVYRDWSLRDGLLLGRNKDSPSALAFAPNIRIGRVRLGADKFEHMFGTGFNYFKAHYRSKKPMLSVLRDGALEEKWILGGSAITTGVFSHADLSADFNGMRFWNHVLQKKDDLMGVSYNKGPFVACEGNQFEARRPIDFRNYVDPSMNEGVNCSDFATAEGLRKFKFALKQLGNLTCPLNPKLSQKMAIKYRIPLDAKGHLLSDEIINLHPNQTVIYP